MNKKSSLISRAGSYVTTHVFCRQEHRLRKDSMFGSESYILTWMVNQQDC
jgi:hypothetical protein